MFYRSGWLRCVGLKYVVPVVFQEYQVQFKFELVKGYWCSGSGLAFERCLAFELVFMFRAGVYVG